MKAISITLILLVFTIGCEPKKEKINLETFLIGDIWCNDKLKTEKICFEFTSGDDYKFYDTIYRKMQPLN